MARDGWWLFLAVPWGCLRFVIVVFPYHSHLPCLRVILNTIPGVKYNFVVQFSICNVYNKVGDKQILLNILNNTFKAKRCVPFSVILVKPSTGSGMEA